MRNFSYPIHTNFHSISFFSFYLFSVIAAADRIFRQSEPPLCKGRLATKFLGGVVKLFLIIPQSTAGGSSLCTREPFLPCTLLLCIFEALVYHIPIHHMKPIINIIRTPVLIF